MTNAEKKGLAVMAAGLAFTNAATAGRFRWIVAASWLTVTVYWFIVCRSLKGRTSRCARGAGGR